MIKVKYTENKANQYNSLKMFAIESHWYNVYVLKKETKYNLQIIGDICFITNIKFKKKKLIAIRKY